ncbi:MAG: hypothetical protein KAI25_15290, partial [Hyphomicrobiaceae bacterium]|nr:hypothetical protein [Hyphomicrobiaceae bacterium]
APDVIIPSKDARLTTTARARGGTAASRGQDGTMSGVVSERAAQTRPHGPAAVAAAGAPAGTLLTTARAQPHGGSAQTLKRRRSRLKQESVHRRLTNKRRRTAERSVENDMHLRQVCNDLVDLFFYSETRAARHAELNTQLRAEVRKRVRASKRSGRARTVTLPPSVKTAQRKMKEVAPLRVDEAFRRYMIRLTSAHYRFLLSTPYGQENAHAFAYRNLCFTLLTLMSAGGLPWGSQFIVPPCRYIRRHMPGPTHYETFGIRAMVATEMEKRMRAVYETVEDADIPYDALQIMFEEGEG